MAGTPRKTIAVDTLKAWINRRLESPDTSVSVRKELCALLETILFDAHSYGGYNDVHWANDGGHDAWVAAGCPDFPAKLRYIHGGDGTDSYRRRYY